MTRGFEPRPGWISEFSRPPEDCAGAVLALDFSDDDGLWAGRVDQYLMLEKTIREERITGVVLDVRTATCLRDHGGVSGADDPEAFGELIAIVRRARERLVDHHSVLLMGDEHLRLVTVSLDSLMAATVPEVNRVHGMIVELAGADPVAAVLLGPGHEAWPGLWESLTERGYSVLLPGDPYPPTYAGDDRETNVLNPVDEPHPSLAWEGATEVVPATPTLDVAPQPQSAGTSRRGVKVAAVAAALLVVAGGGTAAAIAMNNDDQAPPAATTAGVVTTTTTTTTSTPPTTADAADIKAARAPMSRYLPPPSPKTTSTPTTAKPAPQPRTRRPHRRVLPNPIPGLPPIVIG
ncbi:MAG: hypothetical protein QM658_01980 [Gordonia sp. (in: high G+C Gram-positive bacteria)]